MKKLNKVAMLFASAALVTAAGAQTVDNWRNGTNELVWKNGTNELCWRDANWTPATAAATCDGALKPVAAPRPLLLRHLRLQRLRHPLRQRHRLLYPRRPRPPPR